MDRGLVFTMVAKYFEVFDQKDREVQCALHTVTHW